MALPDAGAGSQATRFEDVTVPGFLVRQDASLVRTSLTLADGKITDAAPAQTVQMGGAMVLPCFVDMHTHLDKAQIWNRTPNPDGTFMGALESVRDDKVGRWDRADLVPRMSFALRSAYAHGTAAIRTHLDYVGDLGAAAVSWEVFSQLREEWSDRIALQAVALTIGEMCEEDGALDRCADLVAKHRATLGMVSYPDARLNDWLTQYMSAAAERGLDIDFHTDETMDPEVNTLKDIAELAIKHDFPKKIVVGHVCSLSTMPEDEALKTLDLVARAGIHVVSLPMCNLYLQDRHAARTPRNRGITLVHEMKARGIPISFASDNTRDPFYAYGDMDMIEVMREATRIGHLDHADPDWLRSVLTTPADTCGFDAPSLAPGAPADLVICKARNWTEFFARPQSDRIVLRKGRAIDRTLPDFAELDPLMETP
ncbi:MAG: cytosine deaminase [Pseudomonadota bacterium]